MAAIIPPVCPICGDPASWACGLVYHEKWVHFKATEENGIYYKCIATIVERTPRGGREARHAPASPAPCHDRRRTGIVTEVCE